MAPSLSETSGGDDDLPEIVPLELILDDEKERVSAVEDTPSAPVEEEEPPRDPNFVLQRSGPSPSHGLNPEWRAEDPDSQDLSPTEAGAVQGPIEAAAAVATVQAGSDTLESCPHTAEWVSYVDGNGETFYYNEATGNSTWDCPEGFVE